MHDRDIHTILCTFLSCTFSIAFSQHQLRIEAELDAKNYILTISQELDYHNTASVSLDTLYLLDWNNSFSDKTTPLARRFAEDFKAAFHFQKEEDRGRTLLHYIADSSGNELSWERGDELDIITVPLDKPLLPGGSRRIKLFYEVKIPDAKFTRFGHKQNGDYSLQYWYILPAVFDGEIWRVYSNKDLEDLYSPPVDYTITFSVPDQYRLFSGLDVEGEVLQRGFRVAKWKGNDRKDLKVYIRQQPDFEVINTEQAAVWSSIDDRDIFPPIKAIQAERVLGFLEENLGPYPFEKIIISAEDYQRDPVYGFNQLPRFIRPFPDGFQYEMELLKTLTGAFVRNTLHLNPREDHWLYGALQIYLMMAYTDRYYPDIKIVGKLGDIWGLRWFHAARKEFNDQYPFLYNHTARLNIDQPLATHKDSLIKFNHRIASPYKGGTGLYYLNHYLNKDIVKESISEFYQKYHLKFSHSGDFRMVLESKTEKDTDWFFEQYIGSNVKFDYKLKKIRREGDSLEITVKNRRDNSMPFSLYSLNKKTVVDKEWVSGFDSTRTFTTSAMGRDRLAINHDQLAPEYNLRNNHRKVKGLFKKPVQLRLLQDVEDPRYHQVFVIPTFTYNLYDGVTIGPSLHNKTVLTKNFRYRLEPHYGFVSHELLGGGSVSYLHNVENRNLYAIRSGISGSRFSYNTGLFYNRLNAYSTVAFRDKYLRSNKRHVISLRNILVHRDRNPDIVVDERPNYNVTNLNYTYSNVNLIDYFRARADYEISGNFQKIFASAEYRKLFLSNRHIGIRLFAGTFLSNRNPGDSDYFSFALDRPTDYLFDYNYYGRSEESGLFSQQLIIAEGGFKSRLGTPFADRWMATLNGTVSIWRWFYAYGDMGWVKNRGYTPRFVHDSGLRVSLVEDYFELYFPIHSSNGWETGYPDYHQRIRFIVTLRLDTLMRLFRRRWY